MEELAFAPLLIAMEWWEESYALFWRSLAACAGAPLRVPTRSPGAERVGAAHPARLGVRSV